MMTTHQDAAGVLLLNARSMAAHERDHLGHTEIAAMLESLCAALAEARQQLECARDEQLAIENIVDHWFVQGGAAQFGKLDSPQNPDELISAILARVRATLAEARQQLDEDRAVCLCGCPAADHEQYDDGGESCGRDDHQCLRVCRAVADLFAAQAQEIALLKKDGEQAIRVAQAAIRDAVVETADAQRERDAQVCREYAGRLRESSMERDAQVAEECADAIQAARTPQEPT